MLMGLLVCGVSNKVSAEADYPPVDVSMALTRLSEHCYYVQGGTGISTDYAGFISNAGVVIGADSVLLIDSLGTPALANKLLALIRDVTDKPIKTVIVTHYHTDHMYGLQVFKDQGAEIIAAHSAVNYVTSNVATTRLLERRFSLSPWINAQTRLIPPDMPLKTDLTLDGDQISVQISVHGTNHSDSDLSVRILPDQVLYTGDLVVQGRLAFIGEGDTAHWLQQLNSLDLSQTKVLVPGHGEAFTHIKQGIQATQSYLTYLRDSMRKGVNEFMPFTDIYQQTEWQAYRQVPTFDAANRRNAYQVYLSLEAEVIQQ